MTQCPGCGEGLRSELMSLSAWGEDVEGGVIRGRTDRTAAP
ncbi:MAG TPA: hypothetical protein VES01_05250 [Dermatophilaceae bacterium]|nr:hypothetical protein [Dermatophilaceae bacterium]